MTLKFVENWLRFILYFCFNLWTLYSIYAIWTTEYNYLRVFTSDFYCHYFPIRLHCL